MKVPDAFLHRALFRFWLSVIGSDLSRRKNLSTDSLFIRREKIRKGDKSGTASGGKGSKRAQVPSPQPGQRLSFSNRSPTSPQSGGVEVQRRFPPRSSAPFCHGFRKNEALFRQGKKNRSLCRLFFKKEHTALAIRIFLCYNTKQRTKKMRGC